jgi:hypothetical protein
MVAWEKIGSPSLLQRQTLIFFEGEKTEKMSRKFSKDLLLAYYKEEATSNE